MNPKQDKPKEINAKIHYNNAQKIEKISWNQKEGKDNLSIGLKQFNTVCSLSGNMEARRKQHIFCVLKENNSPP